MSGRNRIAAIILCAILLLTAGCKSSAPAAPAPAAPAGPAPSASSAAPEVKEIKWPERDITIIVPFAAGGGTDLGARLLVPYIEKELGVAIAINNIAGAGGWTGYIEMLNSKHDGYTLSFANWPASITTYMNPTAKLPYTTDDFRFVANQVSDYCVFVVNKDETRFRTFEELIEYTKDNEIFVGTGGGIGSDDHVTIERVNKVAGTKMTMTPFQGGADATAAILGGHVDAIVGNVGEWYIKAAEGEALVLAVAAKERDSFIPDVPTVGEILGTDVISASDRGIIAPSGLPDDVYDKLCAAIKRAGENPEYLQKCKDVGLATNMMVGAEFTAYIEGLADDLESMRTLFGW
jgi:tripartite-type tricarboxylate transporter receptor subunit TctC